MAFVSGKIIKLTAKCNPADTTLYADTDVGITAGRLYFSSDLQEEWIEFTGVAASGTAFAYSGLTRGLSQTADPATAGTGKTWIAGNSGTVVAMHDQIIDKALNNTFGGIQTFTDLDFTGTTTGGLKVKSLTTAQRTAITNAANGLIVYDTDLGENYQYIGGAWNAISAGSTQPNASTTVAGKTEIGTQTEVDAPTDTGGSGATNVVIPSTFQQGITNRISTTVEALEQTNDTTLITPLKLADSFLPFGDGSDGDVTITTTVTLTNTMYYNNLTITSPGILIPDGYKVYVRGTLSGDGIIRRPGNTGTNGTNGSTSAGGAGGAGGVALNTGVLGGEIGGSAGGAGGTSAVGVVGVVGTSTNPSYSTINGAAGGAGGTGNSAGGAGGAAGTSTRGTLYNIVLSTFAKFTDYFSNPASFILNGTQYKGIAGSGGGGGGGGTYGGGGGGAGGNGGLIWISAYIINFSGTILSTGGAGGAGGNATDTNDTSGGGGGGGGGNGGVLYLIYRTLTLLSTTTVTGGAGGAAGTGSAGGATGTAGTIGNDGVVIQITI